MHAQYKDMYKQQKDKMDKAIGVLETEYAAIRAGRANPALLDPLKIEYYGAETPISQVASISVPEARTIIIQPWEASLMKEIEKAILKSDIGITPNNDGKVIRLTFPPLTEERRKDLAKLTHKEAENSKVAVRNIRRDAVDHFKALKKKSEITEDDMKDIEKDIQELTDNSIKRIDALCSAKEKEIMEI